MAEETWKDNWRDLWTFETGREQQGPQIYDSYMMMIIYLYSLHNITAGPSSSAAARLLRLLVRIPPGAWKFVCCECCVLSGRGLCDEMITRPAESYRLRGVVVCDLETSWMRRPWPTGGCCAKNKQTQHNKKRSSFPTARRFLIR